MTKQEILDKFNDIDFVYNDSSKHETLSRMLDELLKGHESVKPKKIKGYNPPMYTLYEYKCEKCESLMMNKQPFCMGCGQEVKWE